MPYATIDKPSKYFNTKLYTGNGTSQTITGLEFQPDFLWTKTRSVAQSNGLFDVVRGSDKFLTSNTTEVEDVSSSVYPSFTSDGFTVRTGFVTNYNGATIVGWSWKANGAGVSNTAGTISSTVSANTTSGFSIVSWTGAGSAGTVGHGLGAVPKFIITKKRNNTGNWACYHSSLGNTQYVYLNSTNASATYSGFWNNTTPTSTLISLGTDDNVTGNGDNIIAYCFAEVKGFSKAFSYTGNGSANGTFVYCGFRPAYIMLKCTSTASTQWSVYDVKRDTKNYVSLNLYPSGSNAENDMFNGTDGVCDFVSNGFKFRDTYGWHNASGSTYVGFAIAENPFVSSKGIPTCAR
jgi:hypothetical protein